VVLQVHGEERDILHARMLRCFNDGASMVLVQDNMETGCGVLVPIGGHDLRQALYIEIHDLPSTIEGRPREGIVDVLGHDVNKHSGSSGLDDIASGLGNRKKRSVMCEEGVLSGFWRRRKDEVRREYIHLTSAESLPITRTPQALHSPTPPPNTSNLEG
jgi:hypothetical protein